MKRELAPDIWIITLDETRNWHLTENLMQYIERIEGVYVFNRREHTYCCEMTPSYWLEFVENRAVFKPDTPDAVQDEIDSEILSAQNESGIYVHIYQVDELLKTRKRYCHKHIGNPFPRERYKADEVLAAVAEGQRCNAYI